MGLDPESDQDDEDQDEEEEEGEGEGEGADEEQERDVQDTSNVDSAKNDTIAAQRDQEQKSEEHVDNGHGQSEERNDAPIKQGDEVMCFRDTVDTCMHVMTFQCMHRHARIHVHASKSGCTHEHTVGEGVEDPL